MKETSNVCRKRFAVTAMAEVSREGCTPSFLESHLLFSRRVLSVQRPDSIDPHLLAFRSALDGTESLSPAAKKFRGHQETRVGKTGNWMDSMDPVPRVLEGGPMTHMRTKTLGETLTKDSETRICKDRFRN